MASLARLSRERLEELLQSVVPALRIAGPRPTLMNDLAELADRFHDSEAFAAEMLAILVLTEGDLQRGRMDKAREEADRVSRIARELPRGPMQAVALLCVAEPLVEGSEAERRIATRCIRSARALLAGHRRPDLQLYADEVHARRLVARGNDPRRRPYTNRRPRSRTERGTCPTSSSTSSRSPRSSSMNGRIRGSRWPCVEPRRCVICCTWRPRRPRSCSAWCWTAASPSARTAQPRPGRAGAPSATGSDLRSPCRYRAEAWLRLADLELTQHQPAAARRHLERLENPEALRGVRLEWAAWLADLRNRVDRSESVVAPISLR